MFQDHLLMSQQPLKWQKFIILLLFIQHNTILNRRSNSDHVAMYINKEYFH